MSKKEVLELLRELLRGAERSHTDPDDWSGCNTTYSVDSEELCRNIDRMLKAESR